MWNEANDTRKTSANANEPTETLRGRVTRIFFSNDQTAFTAGVMEIEAGSAPYGKTTRFGGKVLATVGDTIEVTGHFGTHPRFGLQFEVETGMVQLEETPDALAHLLASHADFEGIGPARARKIVEAAQLLAAGDSDLDFGGALEEYPEEIASRANVKTELVVAAASVWASRAADFQALSAIISQGWSTAQAHAIIREYGVASAVSVSTRDPYSMIGKVPRFGFRTVDAVATKMGVSSTDPARLEAGVIYCLDRIGEDGHTWATEEATIARAIQELRPDTLEAEEEIDQTLGRLIERGLVRECKSPTTNETIVADARMMDAETRVFKNFMGRLEATQERLVGYSSPAADEILRSLNPGQRAAVDSALSRPLTIFSGGAGTGKTYSVRAICEVAESGGRTVLLCAPTGKAAKRLEHATGRDAMTIHRLLEPVFEDGRFRFTRDKSNPLEGDILIIDESSMIDIHLMDKTLRAVPHDMQVVLVGDHNQIPSVGAGAILRDLLLVAGDYPSRIHVLSEIVRQAGDLARNTTAILDGVVAPGGSAVWGVEKMRKEELHTAPQRVAAIVDFVTTNPVEPFGHPLDFAWEVQVLAPMRKGKMGTYALNAELQRLRHRHLGNPPPPPVRADERPKPLAGDRIIWTQNDYELQLLNGTQALVVSIGKGGAMEIETEDGVRVEVPAKKRENLELAYAMTIHKSQGSEWPMVILCVSTLHSFMRDRNLLYTGCSRAGKSLTIVGDTAGIQSFAKARSSERRQTFGGFFAVNPEWSPA